MAKIVWTPRARTDLVRLRNFLLTQNPEASQRAITVIRAALQTLKNYPQSGTAVSWLPDLYREWFIPFGKSAYVILYRYSDKEIVIQALRHGREGEYPAK